MTKISKTLVIKDKAKMVLWVPLTALDYYIDPGFLFNSLGFSKDVQIYGLGRDNRAILLTNHGVTR